MRVCPGRPVRTPAGIGGNGYAGMNRSTGGVPCADPQRRGCLPLRAGLIATFGIAFCGAALAQGPGPANVELYISAFASLDPHEIAALGLTLGIVYGEAARSLEELNARIANAASAETVTEDDPRYVESGEAEATEEAALLVSDQ